MSKNCAECGAVIPEGSNRCPNCGAKFFDGAAEKKSDKSVVDEPTRVITGVAAAANAKKKPSKNGQAKRPPDGSQRTSRPAGHRPENAARAAQRSSKSGTSQRPERAGAPQRADKAPSRRPAGAGAPPRRTGGPGGPTRTGGGKKPPKKRNPLVYAIIGISLALVAVIIGLVFLLRSMGFFDATSDAELLQKVTEPTVEASDVVSPSPTPSEVLSVVESPSPTPEVVSEAPTATPTPTPAPVTCTRFELTGADTVALYSRGQTTTVTYVIEPAEAERAIEWTSSDESIATVSDFGVINGRRGGTCTVTGTCGGLSVAVNVDCEFSVPDTVLDLNAEDVTMSYEGETLALAVTSELTDDQKASVVWASSDEAVATVSETGEVTAISDGTAYVTATVGDYVGTCIIRCQHVTGNKGVNSQDSEYTINYEDVTLSKKGEYFQLTITSILGSEVPAYTWENSNDSVATISGDGVVTAVADGTTTFSTSIGSDKFQCVVRVKFAA